MQVVCESKQRLVHLPGLLRRQVIAVHQPSDCTFVPTPVKCQLAFFPNSSVSHGRSRADSRDLQTRTGTAQAALWAARKRGPFQVTFVEFDPQDAAAWSNLGVSVANSERRKTRWEAART